MDSASLGTWVGDAIGIITLVVMIILFILGERNKYHISQNDSAHNSIPSDSIEITFNDNIRSLIYTRILLAMILGLMLDRFIIWIFLNYTSFGMLRFQQIQLTLGLSQVLLSIILAILAGTFFSLIYIRFSPKPLLLYIHWAERTLISLWVFASIFDGFRVSWGDNGTTITHSIYDTMINVIILILLISFPVTPVDFILGIVRKNRKDPKGI